MGDRFYTPRYREIIDSAESIAGEMGHTHIGVEHLFLAILRDGHAFPTQILNEVADSTEIERRLLGEMQSEGYLMAGSDPHTDEPNPT